MPALAFLCSFWHNSLCNVVESGNHQDRNGRRPNASSMNEAITQARVCMRTYFESKDKKDLAAADARLKECEDYHKLN